MNKLVARLDESVHHDMVSYNKRRRLCKHGHYTVVSYDTIRVNHRISDTVSLPSEVHHGTVLKRILFCTLYQIFFM